MDNHHQNHLTAHRPQTLASSYERIVAGEPRESVLPEFGDVFAAAPDNETRWNMLKDRPRLTGNKRLDALAGAIAEYLAHQSRLDRAPAWVCDPDRFLDRPWHTTYFDVDPTRVFLTDGMREYLTFASPAEFKSRNIFTEERLFRRARTPIA